MSNANMELNEQLRRVVSVNGHELRLTNVTSLNNTGSFDRLTCDQGYVLVNRDNVLAYIVRGEIKS